jgi:undecaprenyl-diphosphatase
LNHAFVDLTRAGTSGIVWIAIAIVVSAAYRRPAVLVLTVAADAVADLLAGLIRLAVPRDRPALDPLIAVPHSHSFPSGHAATSFACATVLAALVPRLRVPAFVLAAAIAFSRLYVGVHYPTDSIAGAVLGVGTATALLSLARGRRPRRPTLRSG